MATPTYTYDDATFRSLFPAFSNATTYPEATLQMYFTTAGLYTTNGPDFLVTAGTNLQLLYLMTAHLAQIGSLIAAGQSSGITVSATIDKISTTIQQFQYPNQWQLWLASTEYGKQMLALLQVQSIGGFYSVGGLGRNGFRW